MIDRSQGLLLLNTVLLLTAASCAVPKQTRFQMRFVPPATAPRDVTIAEPPPLAPNIYLNGSAPNATLDQYRMVRVPTPSDMSIVRADAAYQKGKSFYQTGDKQRARKQFDQAVDLLFEASENPTDRSAFERKFDETVENISRYDLAGLGPAVNVEVPGFEKSPLEDILEMTFPVDPKLKTKVKEEVQATVTKVGPFAEVPEAVARYLAAENLPAELVMAPDPSLGTIPWDAWPLLRIRRGRAQAEDRVSFTPCHAAMAETGTLMLISAAQTPTTLNFLPETHIVMVRRDQVVATYEDGWDRLRTAGTPSMLPRAVNFITGPSRTADIEQTIVRGAHGPRRLYVVIQG